MIRNDLLCVLRCGKWHVTLICDTGRTFIRLNAEHKTNVARNPNFAKLQVHFLYMCLAPSPILSAYPRRPAAF
jgi:hypothetical protein